MSDGCGMGASARRPERSSRVRALPSRRASRSGGFFDSCDSVDLGDSRGIVGGSVDKPVGSLDLGLGESVSALDRAGEGVGLAGVVVKSFPVSALILCYFPGCVKKR